MAERDIKFALKEFNPLIKMLFESKDEKVERLEKNIKELEKKIDYNMRRVNETLDTLNQIILHLESENRKLRDEKGFLLERQKKMLRRVPVPDLSREINDRFVKPATNVIKENADLVSLVAKEGFVEIKEPDPKREYRKNPAKILKDHVTKGEKFDDGKSIDSLFEIISKDGRIRSDEAAWQMNVHDVQIQEWAKILEENELIEIKKLPMGKIELVKL
jgi:hypothetical protein